MTNLRTFAENVLLILEILYQNLDKVDERVIDYIDSVEKGIEYRIFRVRKTGNQVPQCCFTLESGGYVVCKWNMERVKPTLQRLIRGYDIKVEEAVGRIEFDPKTDIEPCLKCQRVSIEKLNKAREYVWMIRKKLNYSS